MGRAARSVRQTQLRRRTEVELHLLLKRHRLAHSYLGLRTTLMFTSPWFSWFPFVYSESFLAHQRPRTRTTHAVRQLCGMSPLHTLIGWISLVMSRAQIAQRQRHCQ